jgi:NifB/MoaA-like Fe-S oxidoreductase
MGGGFAPEEIHEMASRWTARPPAPGALRLVTDTSDFFRLESGDVLLLQGTPLPDAQGGVPFRQRLQQDRRARPQLRRVGGGVTVGGMA